MLISAHLTFFSLAQDNYWVQTVRWVWYFCTVFFYPWRTHRNKTLFITGRFQRRQFCAVFNICKWRHCDVIAMKFMACVHNSLQNVLLIFCVSKINGMALFCNVFMEQPSLNLRIFYVHCALCACIKLKCEIVMYNLLQCDRLHDNSLTTKSL